MMAPSRAISRMFPLAAVAFFLVAAAVPSPIPDSRASDRAQVEAMVQRWERAWNTHDMKALASLFRDDAIWVLWTGEVWTGRARFEAGMTEVHKTVYRNSVQHEQLEELTFIGPDAAVVRFQSSLTGDSRYPDRTVHSRKILVLTRSAGEWRIGWGQNTRFFADLQPTKLAEPPPK